MIQKILLMVLLSFPAYAGDDASGTIPREMDLSINYTSYKLKDSDNNWSQSLVTNLKYTGKAVHFVKTDIPLTSNKKTLEGCVYQSIEKPDLYYVSEGDLMFKIGSQYPYSPGVGGFSMHAPKSKNFIVCLNFFETGVSASKSSRVIKGKIKWEGTSWNRLE